MARTKKITEYPHYKREKDYSESEISLLNMIAMRVQRLRDYCDKLRLVNSSKGQEPADNSPISVLNFEVSRINTDVKRFQNRQNEYSEDSKNRIVDAYKSGRFDFSKFDPISIWYDKQKNKYFVLSGHSRLAAFKELGKSDKVFKRIPARIFQGSEAQAIDFALNSNVLSTKETDMERAIYYNKMRQTCEIANYKALQGLGKVVDCAKLAEDKCRENEGKNATYIINLSYLNPEGFLADSMRKIGADKGTDDANLIRTIADWVGDLRKQFPDISDLQETEIAKYLLNGGYGSKSTQFKNKRAFALRFKYCFDKWKQRGADPLVSLNLENSLSKSEFEKEYDARYAKAAQDLEDARAEYEEKHKKYWAAVTAGEITMERMNELEKPLVDYVNKCLDEKKRVMGQKDDVKKASSAQQSLWGTASDDISINFNKQIMRYKRHLIPNNATIFVCQSPNIWRALGIKGKDVYIEKKVIDKALEKHDLLIEHFINFPDALREKSPIFRSKTQGFVQVVNIKDIKGHPVVVAIHLIERDNKLLLYKIASVHGRVARQIYKWEREGLRIM